MEENQNVASGVTLSELVNILYRNILSIIAITITITIIGIIYTYKFVEPTYSANADIMVQVDKTVGNGSSTSDYDLNSTLRIVETVADFFKKDIVIDEVINELNINMTADQVRSGLVISHSPTSLFVNIEYEGKDPEIAVRIVNSLIANAKKISDEKYSILKGTIADLGEAENAKYASPNKPLNIIISFLLGAVIGVVTVLLLEAFKTTVRNKKELESLILNYKVIGEIPQIPTNKGAL